MFEQEIHQLTASIWESILKLTIEESVEGSVDEPQMLSASVQITGAWQGAVSLACGETFATTAASIMFNLDRASVGAADRQDALGELANMIGGNIKALLPEACALSLPTVVEGTEYSLRIPKSKVVTRVPLSCESSALRVVLFEKLAA